MDLSNEKITKYMKRLLLSRMRILMNHGFYGLLLMHMVFALDENCETAATDGRRIFFGPDFLEKLSDGELDFIMMHEILHVVLQHCFRQGERDNERFNIACDIVVNSNILLSNHLDLRSIILQGQPAMHIAPDGQEGYELTAEQVYGMLPVMTGVKRKKKQPSGEGEGRDESEEAEGDGTASGRPKKCSGGGSGTDVPEKGSGGGFALGRAQKKQGKKKDNNENNNSSVDDHSHWGMEEEDDVLRDVWVKRMKDAHDAILLQDPTNSRGLIPLCAERILKELRRSQTDWRQILNDFVQEEIVDYSFTPPDRRFDDSPFYLPDFNDKDDLVQNILFMIDTSGSMSDDMITAAYSEVKGAIDQFNGRLAGWLGFFDAVIVEPQPFENEDEFRIIRPKGGGGTDFQIIFEYVHQYMEDDPPESIIILTDGYAPFPKEHLAMGIPVLWLLNNEEVEPPWGKVARIKV